MEDENLIERKPERKQSEIDAENALLKTTFLDDLRSALFDTRFVAPLIVVLAVFLGYHLTVAPYKTHVIDKSIGPGLDDLKLIRPVLSSYEQLNIQAITLRAACLETEFILPTKEVIALRFHTSVNKNGNSRPPDFFYEGVTFGISSENSFNVVYTGQRTSSHLEDLRSDLLAMEPTYFFNRTAHCNLTSWHESGFAVHFSYADLTSSGRISSDKLQPWKRLAEDMLSLAREHRQIYITVWYPKEFGKGSAEDPHKFKNIVQQTLPTRTGLNELRSTAVVWMTKLNNSEIVHSPKMVKKDWTEEEIDAYGFNRKQQRF